MQLSPDGQSAFEQQPLLATHVFGPVQSLYPSAQMMGSEQKPEEHVFSPMLPGSAQSEFVLQQMYGPLTQVPFPSQ